MIDYNQIAKKLVEEALTTSNEDMLTASTKFSPQNPEELIEKIRQQDYPVLATGTVFSN